MTPHQTLAVAVRLFSVWLVLVIIREVLGSYFFARGAQQDLLPLAVVMGLVATVTALVLWFFPKTIARGLLPSQSDTPAQPATAETWFAIGVSLIGLWLVASAIPGLLRNLLITYLYSSDAVDRNGLITAFVFLSMQIVIGVLLMVGANGVKRFVWWARHAGPD